MYRAFRVPRHAPRLTRPLKTAAQTSEEDIISRFYAAVMCPEMLVKDASSSRAARLDDSPIAFGAEFRERMHVTQRAKAEFDAQQARRARSATVKAASGNPQSAEPLDRTALRHAGIAMGPKWTLEREGELVRLLEECSFDFGHAAATLSASAVVVTSHATAGASRWALPPVTPRDCLDRYRLAVLDAPRWPLLRSVLDSGQLQLSQPAGTPVSPLNKAPVADLMFLKILRLSGVSTALSPLFHGSLAPDGAPRADAQSAASGDAVAAPSSGVWTWVAAWAGMNSATDALRRFRSLIASKKLDSLAGELAVELERLPWWPPPPKPRSVESSPSLASTPGSKAQLPALPSSTGGLPRRRGGRHSHRRRQRASR